MKFKLSFLIFFLQIGLASSQDLTDAVRFAREDMMGTARFSAMGGAFSSLGGDMSSLRLNPAGSSIFLNNHASMTLNLNVRNNGVNFVNSDMNENETTFDLNQAGAVFVYTSNNEDATISKYAYGFTYDQVANFNDSYTARGVNDNTIADFFVNNADGLPLDLLVPLPGESVADLYTFLGETESVSAQNALLGYQSFIFDAVDPDDFNSTDYISNIDPNTNAFRQNYFIEESGYNGKFGFNASVELNKRFYFGLNLNAYFVEYNRFTSFDETNNNPDSGINRITFENQLRTLASAFSFQLGAIAKITPQLRAALSYQSPIWYSVSDETTQLVSTDGNEFGASIVNPNVLNIFPDYNYRTASTWRAGLSYVFGQSGLLSIDYTIQDYSNLKFTTNFFQNLNGGIEQNLTVASNLNIGGEYVFKKFKIRGGYFIQQTPYEDESIMGDLSGYTTGLSYSLGNVNLGLAYVRSSINREDLLYQTGLSETANVDNNETNIFLTLSFGF
jgi:hypothetical protein